MHNYKELSVWQKSVALATNIYSVTSDFPKHELYGLTSQLRRSAVSISSNIAEGAGRSTKKEFIRFLHIAIGSSFELETQLIIAKSLTYLDQQKFLEANNVVHEIQKMIYGLIKSTH